MHELLHNGETVILPADKDLGIVIVNREDYIRKLREEMKNSVSYQETEGNRADSAVKDVKKLVNRMYRDGAISKDMQQYLIPRYPLSFFLSIDTESIKFRSSSQVWWVAKF